MEIANNLVGKLLVAQGGGPTAVINQSLVGVVIEARRYPQITKIYGALNGLEGIVNEDFLDLTQETSHNLEQVAKTPSSALLSTRIKPDEAFCKKIFEVLKAHDVRYFFYIGGNDSSDTVRIINEQAILDNYEFIAIHIPKTIDNDLVLNDHTPGYASAAKFVSQAFMGVNLDNRALSGVYIAIVMGRHSGFLTASSIMAQKFPDDGPHLIYLPEVPFHRESFLKDVKEVYDRFGRCIVAVSEGIVDANGKPIVTKLKESECDAHGNVQLSGTGVLGDLLADYVRDKLKIKRVRSDTFGYLQRSFIGCISEIDQYEAREVGELAVQFAIWHKKDGSVAIKRKIDNYSVEYVLEKLENIAGKTRNMPKEFINDKGNGVTEAFKTYLSPLLGRGLPDIGRLKAPKVKKLLAKS